MSIPRPEYPRPQFVREDWQCLNGHWQFEIDAGDSGWERGLVERELSGQILVPFCPEAPLSGIGTDDFLNAVWYRRTVTLPKAWAGRHVLLHFQAVDYDATVWVNGVEVRRHRGGFTPFTCDLAGIAAPGDTVTIVVRARDDNTTPKPRGKQSIRFKPSGALYRRTTGIWQSVWMEPVPYSWLERPRITPHVGRSALTVAVPVRHPEPGQRVRVILKDDQGVVSRAIPADRRRLWAPEDPFLYDLELELIGAKG